ncbi:MAG: hypothetical protein IT239_04465 [Bacteroidia bacterium]|nr:hypothetical protein [Bacteroidia bacterium]
MDTFLIIKKYFTHAKTLTDLNDTYLLNRGNKLLDELFKKGSTLQA